MTRTRFGANCHRTKNLVVQDKPKDFSRRYVIPAVFVLLNRRVRGDLILHLSWTGRHYRLARVWVTIIGWRQWTPPPARLDKAKSMASDTEYGEKG